MMDKDSKTQFKWKFYRLTLQLNVIIILVALAAICLFLVQIPFRIFFLSGMLIIAGVLANNFIRKYKETKDWLDVHSTKDESEHVQKKDQL